MSAAYLSKRLRVRANMIENVRRGGNLAFADDSLAQLLREAADELDRPAPMFGSNLREAIRVGKEVWHVLRAAPDA